MTYKIDSAVRLLQNMENHLYSHAVIMTIVQMLFMDWPSHGVSQIAIVAIFLRHVFCSCPSGILDLDIKLFKLSGADLILEFALLRKKAFFLARLPKKFLL